MLYLLGGGLEVVLVGRLHLHSRRVPLNAFAPIEAYVVDVHDGVFRHDRAVLVHIGDVYASEVSYSPVVGEHSTTPLASDETDAAEAEAVVNATVEPNMRSPVAAVPAVHSAFITPVAWGPQKTGAGRLRPHAWNPEVARISVGPVARGPEVTRRRNRWLLIDRQRRRSKVDRNADDDLCLRAGQAQHRQHNQSSEKQIAKCGTKRHSFFSLCRGPKTAISPRLPALDGRVHKNPELRCLLQTKVQGPGRRVSVMTALRCRRLCCADYFCNMY